MMIPYYILVFIRNSVGVAPTRPEWITVDEYLRENDYCFPSSYTAISIQILALRENLLTPELIEAIRGADSIPYVPLKTITTPSGKYTVINTTQFSLRGDEYGKYWATNGGS